MVGGKTATNNQFATATRCDARNPRKVGRKLLSSGSFYAQIEPFALDDDDDNDDNDSMIDFLHWQQAGTGGEGGVGRGLLERQHKSHSLRRNPIN